MIRVVLADDQVLVRTGFRALLESEPDITVVGEAGDGAGAVALAREERPDVVLMDIRMPGVDGLTAAKEIGDDPRLAEVKVLVLTTFELDEYVFEALRAGASGFLVKHTEPAELIRAVRVVAAGEALLSPGVTRRLIAAFVDAPSGPAATVPDRRLVELLTAREREVVALVAEGLSNEEIAARWYVSQATVRTHVSRAMTKLAARDRAQLVVFAYRNALGDHPDRLTVSTSFVRSKTRSLHSVELDERLRRAQLLAAAGEAGPAAGSGGYRPPNPPTETKRVTAADRIITPRRHGHVGDAARGRNLRAPRRRC